MVKLYLEICTFTISCIVSYNVINGKFIKLEVFNTSFFYAYNVLVNKMDKLFFLAEQEMFILHNPYVGTEHFLLAYLKEYGSNVITYDDFKKIIIKVIGSSYLASQYVLYTPILRYVKENIIDVKEALNYILSNDDSIAYNILKINDIDIEILLKEINNK